MKAIIVGVDGQDGKLLKEFLLNKGFDVIGINRFELITQHNEKVPFSIFNAQQVKELVLSQTPSQIYYLAGFHHSSEEETISASIVEESYKVHVFGLLNFLEAIKTVSKNTHLFYAGSSLMFGDPKISVVTEETKLLPKCIYGITKVAGYHTVRMYREVHKIFAVTGILFNHESNFRKEKFLSKKVIKAAVEIKKGLRKELVLGDLSSKTDWGYAPDYVKAMNLMLTDSVPDDYIIATGELHTVSDFVETVFRCLNLDYKKYVKQDISLIKRKKPEFAGSNEKIYKKLGWKPSLNFEEMIRALVREEVVRGENA